MTSTLTQPRIKSVNRKVRSLRQITPTYYEVVGDTGNVYHVDTFFGECSCKAGQHGHDCYHQRAVREYQQSQLDQVVDIQKNTTLGQVVATAKDFGFAPIIESIERREITIITTVKLLRFGRAIASLEFNKTWGSVDCKVGDQSRYFRGSALSQPVLESLNWVLDVESKAARLSIFGV